MSRRDGTIIANNDLSHTLENVKGISTVIIDIADKVVKGACNELDDKMTYIRQSLVNNTLDDDLLTNYILDLANILYFVAEEMEHIGIREDMCKWIRTELYNKARDISSGTKADKDGAAELAVKTETEALTIYNRAYKMVRLKYDAGYEMLNSLKKIMNKRISESELSNSRYIGGTRNGNN